MRKVVIFPYHPDVDILLNYNVQLKDVQIVGVYSYLDDKTITGEINKTLGIQNSYSEMLERCDTILILDNYRLYKDELYYEVIRQGIEQGKKIIITPRAEAQLDLETFEDQYILLKNNDIISFSTEQIPERKRFIIENIPVIAVSGMGKNCSKFETQLLLYETVQKQGYRCVWVSSNELGAMFGGYALPDSLFSGISFEDKVIEFNHFVYKLSIHENPDIMIIGIPEGITEFEMYEYNHFGEYPLVIGSALTIDSSILCTYFLNQINLQGLRSLCDYSESKYGMPVHAISVGKTVFESEEGSNRISYSFLEESYLKKYFVKNHKMPIPAICLWNREEAKRNMMSLLTLLQENADAI